MPDLLLLGRQGGHDGTPGLPRSGIVLSGECGSCYPSACAPHACGKHNHADHVHRTGLVLPGMETEGAIMMAPITSVTDFLERCRSQIGRSRQPLDPDVERTYRAKLSRFSPDQLSMLFDRLIETCEYFPKIAEIFSAAESLEFIGPTDTVSFRPHTWEPSDCPFCRGEGRLAVYWRISHEDRSGRLVEIQRLLWSSGYSDALRGLKAPGKDDIRTLFRCHCPAGDAITLSRGWPKWRIDDIERVRYL